jgi:RHS repeat-associated protein
LTPGSTPSSPTWSARPPNSSTPDGDLAWHTRTTLWGAGPPPVDGDIDCPLRFPGQYHDPETGFHYNYHRHYDPTTGRYGSEDPLGLNAGPNPAAYVHNPLARLDPLGLTPYPISMDQAVELGVRHVDGTGRIVVSGSGGYQFINQTVDAAGNRITRIARFDINPNSAHVQQYGPHLNLETQINGVSVRSGPMADPHLPIDPSTIRPGDIP